MLNEEDVKQTIPIIQPTEAVNARVVKPKIDLKKCQKNFNCLVYCPHNAITLGKTGFPVIDYDLCTGCLICLRECPAFAITEEPEKRMPKV